MISWDYQSLSDSHFPTETENLIQNHKYEFHSADHKVIQTLSVQNTAALTNHQSLYCNQQVVSECVWLHAHIFPICQTIVFANLYSHG